jgi:Secretion system C-terminal sorting domain
MKKISLLFFTTLLVTTLSKAQDSCLTAVPFCTGNSYGFTMNTGIPAPIGPDYGCLDSQASPLWFSVYVSAPGDILITGNGVDSMDNAIDVDFIYWGPFASTTGICYAQLDAAHVLGCDYSTSNLINVSILGATVGSYYMVMVSNYSGLPALLSYTQTGGVGVASCALPCSFTALTALPTVCNFADNTYSVSGTMNFLNPPTTGTLTVYGSCGGSQTFTAPFASPLNYTLTGLSSDSNTCFISAIFSASLGCSLNQTYLAPPVCNPSLGIGENNKSMELTIAPNPSNGLFQLNCTKLNADVSISITDVVGRIVYAENNVKNTGSIKKEIDLTAFNKGIYFVKISSEKGILTKKIIYN